MQGVKICRPAEADWVQVMAERCNLAVFIEPGCCWGRILGEDSGTGACDLCVQICPAVFEKPVADRCACVRPHADVSRHAERVLRAVHECPVNAIRVITL